MRVRKLIILLFCASLSLTLFSCKKKNRLTNDTVVFSVVPPALTLVKNSTFTLVAQALSPGGAVEVNPEWTVSSAAGSLNTTLGTSVIVTGVSLGDVTVTAISNGMMATTKVAVVAFSPNANTFDVYTDAGLPNETGFESDITLTFPGNIVSAPSTVDYTPEGNTYEKITGATNNEFWGVTLDGVPGPPVPTKDLSDFSAGTIKFTIRLPANLQVGENIRVRIESSAAQSVNITLDNTHGLTRTGNTDWQEISVPVASLTGVLLTDIRVPFLIVLTGVASSISFDIDAIRWEK